MQSRVQMAAQRYKDQGQCTYDAPYTFALRVGGVVPANIGAKHKRRRMTRWSRFPTELCVTINGEVFFESGQSIRLGKANVTVKTHQWEGVCSKQSWCVIRKYHREAGSCLRRVPWRVHDESVAWADGDGDENVSATRPLTTGASQRACSRGATRGRCESGARVQRRQGLPWTRQRRLHWFRRPVNGGIGREVPDDHEAQGQVNAVTTAEVKSPKSQTCDEHQPRGEWPS